MKEDCLDLPPKNWTKRHITLSNEQKKVYDQMKKEALATLNGKVTSTMTVITQLMRLQQITSHFVVDDIGTQEIKNNRITELMEVLDEIEGKAIIWGHWQKDIQNIVNEIEKIHGRGPWLVIMDSRHRMKGKIIYVDFSPTLSAGSWQERRLRAAMG